MRPFSHGCLLKIRDAREKMVGICEGASSVEEILIRADLSNVGLSYFTIVKCLFSLCARDGMSEILTKAIRESDVLDRFFENPRNIAVVYIRELRGLCNTYSLRSNYDILERGMRRESGWGTAFSKMLMEMENRYPLKVFSMYKMYFNPVSFHTDSLFNLCLSRWEIRAKKNPHWKKFHEAMKEMERVAINAEVNFK